MFTRNLSDCFSGVFPSVFAAFPASFTTFRSVSCLRASQFRASIRSHFQIKNFWLTRFKYWSWSVPCKVRLQTKLSLCKHSFTCISCGSRTYLVNHQPWHFPQAVLIVSLLVLLLHLLCLLSPEERPRKFCINVAKKSIKEMYAIFMATK